MQKRDACVQAWWTYSTLQSACGEDYGGDEEIQDPRASGHSTPKKARSCLSRRLLYSPAREVLRREILLVSIAGTHQLLSPGRCPSKWTSMQIAIDMCKLARRVREEVHRSKRATDSSPPYY